MLRNRAVDDDHDESKLNPKILLNSNFLICNTGSQSQLPDLPTFTKLFREGPADRLDA